MKQLIDSIISKRPTIVEYACGFVSSILVFGILAVKTKEALLLVITIPTTENIVVAISLLIATIWVFWVANRFFAQPLCCLLTRYYPVFSSPMEPTRKERQDNISKAQYSPPDVVIEKSDDKGNTSNK